MKGKTYKPCHCGADCGMVDSKDDICEGEVHAVDEIYTEDDYWWIHACKVHEDLF